MDSTTSTAPSGSDLALVLTGGGARAAYQVGYLRWIAQHIPTVNFPIVTGVSAGAVNAAYLAAHSGTHAEAAAQLCQLWRSLSVDQVFRVDSTSLISHVTRWGVRLVSGGGRVAPGVRGFVDTAPLRRTLRHVFGTMSGGMPAGIARQLARHQLSALALVTINYGTGQSIIWIQGRGLDGWERPKRRSRKTRISLEHVLASSALPMFFPAVKLDGEWYGDGGIRLTAPCSPAIHLGATRILAVTTRHELSREEADTSAVSGYPPPLQISGQLLNAIFLDDLGRDALELQRINRLLQEVPPEKRMGLRPIQLLVARPSRDLGRLANQFEPRMPRVLRHLFRGLGSRETSQPDVLSLLLFDPEYLSALIELGEADAAAQEDEIRALLAPVPAAATAAQ